MSTQGAKYSVLVGIQLNTRDIQEQLNRAFKNVKVPLDTSSVKNATDATKGLADANKKAGESAEEVGLSYAAANRILQTTTAIISSMVDQVYELDGALTEFRKVSNLGGEALDDYVDKLSAIGQEVARTTSEMVEGATNFKRAGFSDEDAATLAKYSAMLQNVSDGELAVGEATDFIISQMKAFNLGVGDTEHILDAVNEVAANFAVSTNDLTTNISKSSAALAVGNNTYEQTIGLFTAGYEITRQASRTSRGLVSIQSRLNQVVDESSSTGKALTEWYKEHNIAIYDQQGQLMSLFDILSQVAKIWDTLSTNEKDYYLNQQAGANQTQNLASILSNFKTAIDATAVAEGAAGSAARQNEIQMQSLESQTNLLKASLQTLANDVIDKELISALLNLANNGLKVLDNNIGASTIRFTLATASLKALGKIITVVMPNIGTLLTGFKGLFTGATTLKVALTGAVSALGPWTLALGAVAAIVPLVIKGIDKLIVTHDEQLETVKQLTDEYDRLYGKGTEYDQLKNASEALTAQEKKRLAYLKDEEKSLREQLINEAKIAIEKDKQQIVQTGEYVGSGAGWLQPETVDKATDAYNKLNKAMITNRKEYTNVHHSQEQYRKSLHTLISNNKTYYEELKGYVQLGLYDELSDSQKAFIERYGELLQSYEAECDIIPQVVSGQQNLSDEADDVAEAFEKEVEAASDLIAQNSTFLQSIDNICNAYETEKGSLQGVMDAEVTRLIQTGANEAAATQAVIQQTQARIKARQQEAMATALAAASSWKAANTAGNSAAAAEAKAQIDEARSAYTQLGGLLSSVGSYSYGGPPPSGGGKSKTDEQLEALKNKVTLEKTNLSLLEEQNASADRLIAQYKVIQDALRAEIAYIKQTHSDWETNDAVLNDIRELEVEIAKYDNKIAEATKDIGDATEEVVDEEEERKKQLEEENRLLEEQLALEKERLQKQADAISALGSLMSDYINKRVDELNKEIETLEAEKDAVVDQSEALEQVNKELNEQIKLEEKIDNLAKARQKKVLVYKDGRYQYVDDIDAISSAEKDLEAYRRELAQQKEIKLAKEQAQAERDLIDTQIQGIQEEIKALQAYGDEWSNLADKYEEEQNRILVSTQLGLDTTEDALASLLEYSDEWADKYADIMTQLEGSLDLTDTLNANIDAINQTAEAVDNLSASITGLNTVAHVGTSGFSGGADYSASGLMSDYGFDEKVANQLAAGIKESQDLRELYGYDPAEEFLFGYESAKASAERQGITKGLVEGWSQQDLSSLEGLKSAGATTSDLIDYAKSVNEERYASGTTFARGGMSLVGEKGPELRVLGQGDGIIPADVTKNLWAWGAYSPSDFIPSINGFNGFGSNAMNVTIQSLSLPNVSDGQGFVSYVRDNLYGQIMQFVH